MFSYQQIKRKYEQHGYTFFEEGSYNLNIFGIRSKTSHSNEFDDYIGVCYKDESGVEKADVFPATTDPGKYWLINPMVSGGTAILIPGQYKGAYKLGYHKNYQALEQKSPMWYVRDNNRDAVIDKSLYQNPLIRRQKAFKANIKTNIHRASKYRIVQLVERYSAGCQVIQDPKQFDRLIYLCKRQIDIHKSNSFTYTLFE